MAKRVLGIYLRPNTFKAIELLDKGDSYSASSSAVEYFSPDEDLSSLPKIVSASFQKNGIRSREAVVALSGDNISYKLVSLPAMPESDIRTALGFKLGLDVENDDSTVLDYYKVPSISSGDKNFYFVVFAKREYIENVISQLRKARVSVKEILPYSCALRSALSSLLNKTCAVIKCDKDYTIVLLIKEGMPVFAREVAFGGENVVQALSGVVVASGNRLEIDTKKAEEILRQYGIPVDMQSYTQQSGLPAPEILAMIRPALEKIGAEILRTIEFYRRETSDSTEFKEINVTGSFSSVRNFDVSLSQELGLKANIVTSNIKFGDEKDDVKMPSLMLALGAATVKQHMLSLLPEEYKKPVAAAIRKASNIYFVSISYAAILLIIYLVFYGYGAILNSRYIQLKKQASNMGVLVHEGLQADKLSGFIAKFGDADNNKKFHVMLNNLDKATPSSIYFSSVNYDAAQGLLTLKGVILKKSGKGAISEFINNLEKNGIFSSIDLSSLNESDRFTEPVFDFEIKCAIPKVKQ